MALRRNAWHHYLLDQVRVAFFFQRACDAGRAKGCFNLALRYQNGEGVPLDLAHASALYRKSSEAGEMQGCVNLGVMYENGSGIARSLETAAGLYGRAWMRWTGFDAGISVVHKGLILGIPPFGTFNIAAEEPPLRVCLEG